ncbi:MAG TPA: aldo/keto reductase [Terriglobia bacterium]|nr:aldo/keto reductase [Terriglobia bacterium]
MNRRDFLKQGSTTAGLALTARMVEAKSTPTTPIPRRILGKTGERLSIVGMGGIVVMGVTQEFANNIVSEAVDRGVNYIDVAPSYGDAQERLGPALERYRQEVFLACKTGKFDKAGSQAALDDSLEKLRTDHVDLYQLHAISSIEQVDQALGPNGAIETFVAARKAGKVRYLGFSAHSEEAAIAAMDRFDFDTILFPTNFVLFTQGHFGPRVIAHAKSKNMGRLAIKSMAKTKWPDSMKPGERWYQKCWYEPCSFPGEASLAYRWTLSQPITAAIPPGYGTFFRLAMDVAQNYKPLTSEEEKELLAGAQGVQPIFPQHQA